MLQKGVDEIVFDEEGHVSGVKSEGEVAKVPSILDMNIIALTTCLDPPCDWGPLLLQG